MNNNDTADAEDTHQEPDIDPDHNVSNNTSNIVHEPQDAAVSAYLHVQEPQSAVLMSIYNNNYHENEGEVVGNNERSDQQEGPGRMIEEEGMKETRCFRVKNNIRHHPFRYLGGMMFILLFILVLVPMSIFVAFRRGTSSSSSPTETSAHQGGVDLTSIITKVSTLESITNSTSPQGRAFIWIQEEFINEDEWSINQSYERNYNIDFVTFFIERYILAVFYYATGGETNWKRKDNFLSHEHHVCDWLEPDNGHYIDCTYVKKVKGINIDNGGLVGTLPNELWYLENLETLEVSFNDELIGTIPEVELTKNHAPKNFKLLRLNYSNLSGSIPSSLGLLSELTTLQLGGNHFTGTIPSELLQLPKLEWLSIKDNNLLQGTIPVVAPLLSSSLWKLDLSNLTLTGTIPFQLGSLHLKSLTDLYLHNNRLTGSIPNQLDHLKFLWIWNNNLEGDANFLCSEEVIEMYFLRPSVRFRVDKDTVLCSCCGEGD